MNLDQRLAAAQHLADSGQLQAAVAAWFEIFAADPGRLEVAMQIGTSLAKLGQHRQAVEFIQLSMQLHPRSAGLRSTLGNLLAGQGRLEEGLAAHDQAVALAPTNGAIHGNRCAVLLKLNRPAEALLAADEALRHLPGNLELRFSRGTCLLRLGRADEAVDELRSVVAQCPTHAPAWVNLGESLLGQGQLAAAETAFERAVAAAPENPDAHFNFALRLLARGEWASGWQHYEWRRLIGDIPKREVEGARWQGTPLPPGSTLLLTAEQGLGDTLQFLRFAKAARDRSQARVVFECPPALTAVLAQVPGIDVLVPQGQPLPSWSAWCPLLSLPHLSGQFAPNEPTQLARPAPALTSQYRQRFGDAFTIAICWQGNPAYRADAQRSVPLRYFETLAQVPRVRLVSVQKHHGREQLARWPASLPLDDLGESLEVNTPPFVETAAVLAAADLVITSDTSVAHLAGALSRPVWLLLAARPDWRWDDPAADDTTPWYPSFRLFRQRTSGEWGEVFERVRRELSTLTGELGGVPI